MVGNDIVDLNEAKRSSNWERQGFLAKLFTPLEQDVIQNSKQPFLSVWRFWSMKEAAYKLYTQLNPTRFYNPKVLECNISGNFGHVIYDGFTFKTITKITSNYIISEAHLNHQEMKSEVVVLKAGGYKSQSEELKLTLTNKVNKTINTPKGVAITYNDFGVPILVVKEKNIAISLTHHGRFGAFAIA